MFFAFLIMIFIVSGCATKPLNIQKHKWYPVRNISNYLLQGQIVGINKNSVDNWVTLRIDDIIIPEPVQESQPKQVFKVGKTVTILFNGPFAMIGPMQPKIGNEIEIEVQKYTTKDNHKSFWGSDIKNYYYERNGEFYTQNGTMVMIPY